MPELDVKLWVDASGTISQPIKLADYGEKFKVVFCFQSWCPGCHSSNKYGEPVTVNIDLHFNQIGYLSKFFL